MSARDEPIRVHARRVYKAIGKSRCRTCDIGFCARWESWEQCLNSNHGLPCSLQRCVPVFFITKSVNWFSFAPMKTDFTNWFRITTAVVPYMTSYIICDVTLHYEWFPRLVAARRAYSWIIRSKISSYVYYAWNCLYYLRNCLYNTYIMLES
jgi:hypothetical protein